MAKAAEQQTRDTNVQLSHYLSELENYLSDLWEFIPLPLCYVNPLGVVLEVNHRFEALANGKHRDLVGSELRDVLGEAPRADEVQRRMLAGEQLIKGVAIPGEDGRRIVNISAGTRKDETGAVTGHYLAFTDITETKELQRDLERKVAERTDEMEKTVEELRDSRRALMNILEDAQEARQLAEEEKAKVETIISNFADGLIFLDEQNRIEIVNPKMAQIFEIEAEQYKGRPAGEVEEPEMLSEILTYVLENGDVSRKEVQIGEAGAAEVDEEDEAEEENAERSVQDTGRIFELTAISAVREEQEAGTLVTLHDITREKRIERLKSEFVSIAAHQLRTPLSAIKWTLKMLLDGELGKLNKNQLDFVEKTYQSNERMIRLINDLLNVTRIEEGRYIYDRTPAQLEDICKEVLDSVEETAKRKNIETGFITPKKKLPQVEVDKEKIRLVMQNLVDNAIKYTSEGGDVVVSLSKEEDAIRFAVEDNGVGIPEDQQDRVFSRFFRGANIVRMDTTGTGLGLFIAKNIVEAHGGEIWFDSEEGEGTTFYFTVPLEQEEEQVEEFLRGF